MMYVRSTAMGPKSSRGLENDPAPEAQDFAIKLTK